MCPGEAYFTKEAEVRKQALPFVPARYNRAFDIISEVNCILLNGKRRIQISALYPNSDVIFDVNCVFIKEKADVQKGKKLPPCGRARYI